jgi:hypothetical protein
MVVRCPGATDALAGFRGATLARWALDGRTLGFLCEIEKAGRAATSDRPAAREDHIRASNWLTVGSLQRLDSWTQVCRPLVSARCARPEAGLADFRSQRCAAVAAKLDATSSIGPGKVRPERGLR